MSVKIILLVGLIVVFGGLYSLLRACIKQGQAIIDQEGHTAALFARGKRS